MDLDVRYGLARRGGVMREQRIAPATAGGVLKELRVRNAVGLKTRG